MKREQIKILKEKVIAPYEVARKKIEDEYGNEYSYTKISLINKKGKYWAMNTDNNIKGNWVIKLDAEFIQRATGIDEALKILKQLNK